MKGDLHVRFLGGGVTARPSSYPAEGHFLRALSRHLPRGFTLIWGRSQPHRTATVRDWLAARAPRIVVEWLPAHAPDCNPPEHIWGHTKFGDLANFAPADLDHLEDAVITSFTQVRRQRVLLGAFFRAAGLEL